MYNISSKYKSKLQFTLKSLILTGAFIVIYNKVSTRDLLSDVQLFELKQNGIFITAILFLSLLNWILEILKWKNLSGHIRPISFFEATKQSLAALTASLLTPNRIGEYGAKALFYPNADRKKVMALNFLGNFYQMLVTVIFGLFSLFYLRDQLHVFLKYVMLLLLLPGFLLLLKSFYKETAVYRFYLKFLTFTREIPFQLHLSNSVISISRYLIFSHQFYFLMLLFGITLNYPLAMALIAAMYFLSSVIPGFVALDFLIKGSVALTLFGFFGVSENLILTVTTLMWLMNFALPALFGSYYVMRFTAPEPIKIQSN